MVWETIDNNLSVNKSLIITLIARLISMWKIQSTSDTYVYTIQHHIDRKSTNVLYTLSLYISLWDSKVLYLEWRTWYSIRCRHSKICISEQDPTAIIHLLRTALVDFPYHTEIINLYIIDSTCSISLPLKLIVSKLFLWVYIFDTQALCELVVLNLTIGIVCSKFYINQQSKLR